MRRSLTTIALLAALQVTTAQADVRPPSARTPLGDEQLSDESTVTRWAQTLIVGPIRSDPSAASRTVAKLHVFTEDREFEVYLVLASRVARNGQTWLQVRIPGWRSGLTGWTLAENLSEPRVVRTKLVIDRAKQRATLTRGGTVVWTSPVGVGMAATPTPAGRFWVRELLRNRDAGGAYGPYAFGTSAYSKISDWPRGGVVGIHGTNEPQLIPGRPSHGCVRVPNAKIRLLAKLMPIGTPIEIL